MDKFEQWMKDRLESTPSKEVDEKVLSMARVRLKKSQKNFWAIPAGSLVAAGLVGFLFLSRSQTPMRPELLLPADLLYYQEDLELMVETAPLSDDDWENILGEKS